MGELRIHGVALGPHALAEADDDLRGLVGATLGETRIALWRAAGGGVHAFVAEVGGEALALTRCRPRWSRIAAPAPPGTSTAVPRF
ncbi:MAG TPA: hypothetical protein VLB51_02140 [Methylomirabilota bacterium]|nr:hypothetical protein [Methylomirabilota bacterium]